MPGMRVQGSFAGAFGVQVALIYPAPGSTAIPDAFTQVIIASSSALPASFDVALSYSTGGVLFGTILPAPTPFPSPAATPPFADPVYYTSNNTGYTFAPGTLLTAQINDVRSACSPGTSLGSFTTNSGFGCAESVAFELRPSRSQ